MVGAKAATGNGLVADLRRGHVGWSIRRLRKQDARTRAEELALTTWTEDRREDADLGGDSRDVGATPVRWTRLT